MGKAKKKNMLNSGNSHKMGLEQQIVDGKVAKPKQSNKFRLRAEEKEYIDSKTSGKILSEARKQQAEINLDNFGPTPAEASAQGLFDVPQPYRRNKLVKQESDEESADEAEFKKDVTEQDFFDDIKVDAEDEKAFEMFQHKDGPKTKTLADIIAEKIAMKKDEINTQFSDIGSLKIEDIDPRVRGMYEGVRDVMKKYRSGKVPKAFKIIPKLRNWEQVLYITEPHNWSAAAVYRGTRIFSSVLAQHMAQRYYNLVLLPRIRDDLAEYKKLNPHLYCSLKKALFKPAAFMKGIILPLLEAGDCTLREAIIFGSVIARNQIPVLHSSACLLKICEMEYSGANSIFIRTFLDKRYALPYRVVDAAVFHFLKFEHDKREMPVLWFQSFLTFVQRYKNDISNDQKEALFGVLRKHYHPKITPEIRRELQAARCRDVECKEPENDEKSTRMDLDDDVPAYDDPIQMD